VSGELTCRELVEIVTDYLEGALTPAERGEFEAHIAECDGCAVYLDSIRRTIEIAGRLTEHDVLPEMERELLVAFRDWDRR
jgi:anti-sigma factor RsiW